TIYCIGIYQPLRMGLAPAALSGLANATGGEVVFPDARTPLRTACTSMAAAIREQYTIGYVLNNSGRNDRYRKIRVTATDNQGESLRVRVRPGYMAPELRQQAPEASIAEFNDTVVD